MDGDDNRCQEMMIQRSATPTWLVKILTGFENRNLGNKPGKRLGPQKFHRRFHACAWQ